MGVTPLLTNSQNRLYGAYSFINIFMRPLDKLRSFATPKVDYIEKLSNYSLDIDNLLNELEIIKPLQWHDQIVQTKFSLKFKFEWRDIIDKMPYTKTVLELLTQEIPYNSVFYRYLKPLTCYRWHTDQMKSCVHIPLITNEGCKFVYTDRVFTMPADGSVYLVNNSVPHTFVNSGDKSRLHITLDIF